ncbi:hypothetical protein MBLNU457_7707t2 [Dothideomycetes sp. NU457]
MRLRKAARIILVGAPGVGKGTQTERMLQRFPQLSAISSGDLLRENVRQRTPLGSQAEAIMKAGGLVPDSTILRLITAELTNRGWLRSTTHARPYTLNTMASPMDALGNMVGDSAVQSDNYINIPTQQEATYEYSESPDASFILDGFPRNATQAAALASLLPINLVVNIKTPVDVILDRICNRWIHLPSNRVYNTTYNAPKVPGRDDITGEPLVQRDDDKPEIWKARLSKFEETSLPLLEHYDRAGVLYTVEGNSSNEITPKLFDEFNKRFGEQST